MRNSFFQFPAFIVSSAFLLLFSPTASADDSLKKRLDERSIKFEIDDDGDYKVVFSYTKEKRTQLVFVSGKTESLNDLAIREIFAPVANIKTAGIDGKKALELLENSRKNKLGSWEISGDVLYLVIKIPDNIDAATLETAIDSAAETADEMEIKLTGKDDF